MPIYAYRCESCGFEKDVLQKLSDAPLTKCTHCGAETFRKQVTAAGFQLKGSGWYVTDFRGGNSGNNGNGTGAAATGAKAAGESAAASEGGKPSGESAAAPAGSGTSASVGSGTSTNTSATASTAGTT